MIESDDSPKKRVMRGAMDTCGMWAPIILPVSGVTKDDISVPVAPAIPDELTGPTLAFPASRQELLK